MVDFAEKFRSNFAEKRSFKNSRTFLIKQDGNFAHFWGGGKWWALACAITTTETPTTYKFCLFKRGDFELKTPACFAMPFGLGILLHRFFLSEIIINFALLTTMSSEMYQWQSFLTIFMIHIISFKHENLLTLNRACCFVIGPNSYKLALKGFGILLQVRWNI